MERRNGNKYQSESSSLSSKKGIQEPREEEPCEICGSVGIAGLMTICFKCRHTREHTYCAKVFLSSVPIWLCEACRLPPRVLHISHVADLMDTETTVAADPKNTRVDDHGTANLRANDIEDVVDIREASTRVSSCGISADVNSTVMHLPSRRPHTSPLAKDTLLSQKKEQHQPTQAFPKKRRTIRGMGKHHSQPRGRTLISPLDQSLTGGASTKVKTKNDSAEMSIETTIST